MAEKLRVFLSYHTPDHGVARRLADALARHDPTLDVFFDRYDLRAGAFWVPALAEAIGEADAVIVLLGARSPGPWQRLEYFEALARKAKEPGFAIVPVVLPGATPRLPFLYQLHQLQLADPNATEALDALLAALRGEPAPMPSEPWRTVNPYRGLLVMTDADADFFFGREQLTADILERLRRGERMLTLVGNSGVGKSSVVQAGVVAALRRQLWPGDEDRGWPGDLKDSRSWLVLTMKPGERPLVELARAFVAQWTEPTDPARQRLADDWAKHLRDAVGLEALLRATSDQFRESFGLPEPGRFVLVVDQAEELYTRAGEAEAQRFAEILATAAQAPKLTVLASLRSDHYGHFQADAALFAGSTVVDVPPLREDGLRQVVERPPALLGARFEDRAMSERVVHSTARQPGALPLLSYLLEDLWKAMQRRGDGVLRWSDYPDLVGVRGVLARRSEEFFETCREDDRAHLQRLFTLWLVHVPLEGDVARRRARRTDCTEAEWRLVETLAGSDWRLLVTGGIGGDATAEVAHEVLLRDWQRLGRWLEAERSFLAWKGELENDRREWQRTGKDEGALLRGARLVEAEDWLARRDPDLLPDDGTFVEASVAAREREWATQTRRRRWIVGSSLAAAVAMAVLAVVSFGQWQEAESQRREAERNFEAALGAADGLVFDLAGLEDISGMRAETVGRILERARGVYDRLAERATPSPRLRHSQAAMFMKFTDTYLRLGQLDRARDSAERAVSMMGDLAAADPGNAEWQRDLSVAHNNIGVVLQAQGKLAEAMASYQAGLAIAQRLAESDPGNAGWQGELSRSHDNIGIVLRAQGKLAEAMASYQAELAIAQRLAESDPGNAGWLSIAQGKIGLVLRAQGKLAEAMASYQAGLAIAQRLAESDPGNAGWQGRLSAWHSDIGIVLQEQGKLAEAMASYQAALAIAQRLVESDPGNAEWQGELFVVHNRIGIVLQAQGKLAEAMASYQAALAIAQRLAESDPGHAGWQRKLLVQGNIGIVLQAQGKLAEAMASYQAALAIAQRLAESDPGNAEWQHDLSIWHSNIGDVLKEQGKLAEAMASYQAALAIAQRLAESDPGNAEWQRDLSVSHNKIGDVLKEQGKLAEAMASYQAALAIAQRLAESDPGNAGWQSDLSVSHMRLGNIAGQRGDKKERGKEYGQARDILLRLTALDPSNATWRNDLAEVEQRLNETARQQGGKVRQ